jgi:hypothetical protein
VAVHSILPPTLTTVVDEVLVAAGIAHVAHGDADPVGSATAAAGDPHAQVIIGPLGSRDVAEAIEASAAARLPMIAPVATWVGITRDDEPGSEDDPARHQGTIFRLVARDSVVAQRITDRIRDSKQHAFVIAGDHDYGRQLDAQLVRSGLPRVSDPTDADIVVLAGLAGNTEITRARALAPLPIIAFDGIQPEAFPDQPVVIALVNAQNDDSFGAPETRRAAELAAAAIERGGDTLQSLRELGPFDDHGDLFDPLIRFVDY